jgi:hypothetical protein
MMNCKIANTLELIEKQRVISGKDLHSRLLELEPELKYSTLKWRLYSLKEQGLIKNTGRGLYALGSKLPIFHAPINRKIRLMNNLIKEEFPYLNFSIWSTQWLSDYMLHQPMSYITLVDVDPDASSSVFNKLKDKWGNTKVLYRPTAEEFDRYAVGVQNLIIVKDLISEAPIEKIEGVSIPMLEKIIVDIFTEKNIFAAFNGKELSIIFNELDSRYSISRTKLLRYARRRSAEELLDQLKISSDKLQGAIIDNR